MSATHHRVPGLDEIDQISAIEQPILRNLRITQCYHELALAMTARTGICANWCTFATWASRQAGRTIRQEDLSHALDDLDFSAQAEQEFHASAQALGLKSSPQELEATAQILVNPDEALDRASDAVARGNKKVFDEIGLEFARFYAACLSDTEYSQAHIDQFCVGLRAGDPPEGQRLLQSAFRQYYHALFELDPKRRAERMLLANVQIGLHEQTRLQPEITEAMEGAIMTPRDFRLRLIRAFFPYQSLLAWLSVLIRRLFGRRTPLDDLLEALLKEARRQARLLITRHLMSIEFPHNLRLRLSEDVPGEYPASLAQLDLADLRDLLGQLDRTPDSTRGTGAADWSALPDRLHYIADLFRCYHENQTLFEPPFSATQIEAMRAGRIPAGPL